MNSDIHSIKVRKTIVQMNILKERSWVDLCSCQKYAEHPRIDEMLTLLVANKTDAIGEYWDKMNQCTLTVMLKESHWTFRTLMSLIVDDCRAPVDSIPICPPYSKPFLMILHYWLAKSDEIAATWIIGCSTLPRLDDLQRRRAILKSMFLYTKMSEKQTVFVVSTFDTNMRYMTALSKKRGDKRCHNCMHNPTQSRLIHWSVTPCIACSLCQLPTCEMCCAICKSCQTLMCYGYGHFITDNFSVVHIRFLCRHTPDTGPWPTKKTSVNAFGRPRPGQFLSESRGGFTPGRKF